MAQRIFPSASLLAIPLLLAACAVGPDFTPPPAPGTMPSSWGGNPARPANASVVSSDPVDPGWWKLLDDPELASLEKRVARANLDVQAASLRLAESRSQRKIAASAELPTLDGNASYEREEASQKGIFGLLGASSAPGTEAGGGYGGSGAGGVPGSSSPSFSSPIDLFQDGFDASWELDLWGRVRRSVESADASVQASADDRRNILLTSLAEVARDYIELRGLQAEITLARQNIASDQETGRIVEVRAAHGLTTQLDVANAQAESLNLESELPQLIQQEAQTVNALSFLLGEPPGALKAELGETAAIPAVPPIVPAGIPSELARRRPDVRAAEARLHAATADIGEAEGEFYPSLTLNGSFGYQALEFQNLFNGKAEQYSFGPAINLPIFEGGKLTGQLHLREASQKEAAITYQKTVLQAWHDVDNALTAYNAEQARHASLEAQVKQSGEALAIAKIRYRKGAADFLNVLVAERTSYQAQRLYADSTASLATDLVQLYKALGGGWEPIFPDDARAGDR